MTVIWPSPYDKTRCTECGAPYDEPHRIETLVTRVETAERERNYYYNNAEQAEAEVQRLSADLLVQQRATDDAEATLLRIGEDNERLSWLVNDFASRAERAEAALAQATERNGYLERALEDHRLALSAADGRTEKAEAEVERLRARVRTLCEIAEYTVHPYEIPAVRASELRAAIDGGA
jgi:chromosome segregation ATPase